MKTNKDYLVMHALSGRITHPVLSGSGYRVGYDGIGRINLGTGGITYNFKLGDTAMSIVGDHVEPGVSIKNVHDDQNNALQTFACIGNTARVMNGDAKGATGFVTGKHGGIDHVIIYFKQQDLEKLAIDDTIQIRSFGQGLKLHDFDEIQVMNIDPDLLSHLEISETAHELDICVTHVIPSHLMGSGTGSATLFSGDYDIMTQDPIEVEKYKLSSLRFGDIVYIENNDCTYGPHYKNDYATIGVIVHSDSFTSGHGPGVCVIMSGPSSILKPKISASANIANYLNI
ncbi:MAG: DUF4438 domain-containing protein [Erysipelotrichaceae bacterium]